MNVKDSLLWRGVLVSFQEKSTWIMALVVAGVYAWYFVTLARLVGSDAVTEIGYQGMMLVTVIVLVVLAVVGHVVIAVADPKGSDQNDERDRSINRYGEYVGGFALAVGSVVALGLAMADIDQFWIANTILAGLVLSELISAGTKLVLYRRGM